MVDVSIHGSFQEYGGGSRSTEEVPGVRRRFQEYEGGSRSTEEVPGVRRRCQGPFNECCDGWRRLDS
ncbi:hypothetical protein BM1_00425 [Bipolaris maydis]|nr:hypothetical protein BM1_00425 [Bipolaris maydis]